MCIRLNNVGKYCDITLKNFGKKNLLFRWSSFWFWRVCKQAKLSHLGHRKHARIYWKHPKPVTGNWAIFLRKWVRRGRYSQWQWLSGHVDRYFVHKNWRGGYWQHLSSTGRRYVPHSRSYSRCFEPRFWRSHYQAQSWCRLATSELQFDTVGLLFVGWRQR